MIVAALDEQGAAVVVGEDAADAADELTAGHVRFARQFADKAWAYAVAVERRYRGLPPLPVTSCARSPGTDHGPRRSATCIRMTSRSRTRGMPKALTSRCAGPQMVPG